MRGVVHGTSPQTPAMAEHVAIALRGQVANRRTVLAADCTLAILIAQSSVEKQLHASSKFAGIRLFAQSLEGTSFIERIRHVKAHRSSQEIEALEMTEREYAVAN
eukprot:6146456-Pyramimonas_sp.AAC.1